MNFRDLPHGNNQEVLLVALRIHFQPCAHCHSLAFKGILVAKHGAPILSEKYQWFLIGILMPRQGEKIFDVTLDYR